LKREVEMTNKYEYLINKRRMKIQFRLILIMLLIFTITCFSKENLSTISSRQESNSTMLNRDIKEGEAIVWYLLHSGWAVNTKNHFLIFDYWPGRGPYSPNQTLENGVINPREIKDQKVIVFVSHAHGDHYDRVIHKWENKIKNINYVFGWKVSNNPNFFCFTKEREKKTIGDIEIQVINHSVDRIPEVAFLVKVDGLSIYHSGDHSAFHPPHINAYKDNINYLATKVKYVDLAFIMTVDGGCRKTKYTDGIINGAFYSIEKLRPKMMFPMHGGGCEKYYEEFYQLSKTKGLKTKILPARNRGDKFIYKNKN